MHSRLQYKQFILFIILLLIAVNTLLKAQTNSNTVVLSSQDIEMLPYKIGSINTTAYYDESFTSTLPSSVCKLYESKMDELIAILEQNAVLNPPKGFEVKIEKRIENSTKPTKPAYIFPGDDSITSSSIEIHFSPYYLENGQPAVNFKVSSFFQIHLNNPYVLAGTPLMADVYPCPQKIDDFYGHAVYATNREEVTILNFSNQPVFLPVSQEEFINLAIRYWEHKIDEEKAAKENYLLTIEGHQKTEEIQRQKDEFEQAYNQLLQYDKKAADDLKKTFEEVMAMNLFENNDAAVFNSAVSFAKTQISKLNEELSAMGLDERKRQGVYDINAFEMFNNASGLVPASHKAYGDALVRTNPDLVTEPYRKIQIASVHYHLLHHEFDKPRSCAMSEDAAYITDNKLLSVYNDKELWIRIFQTLSK